MGLPARQQRVLETIEITLKRHEPRLASMFAMFTRLTHAEGLPRTEVLVMVPWWSPRRLSPRLRPLLRTRAALLLTLAAALIVAAVFLGMSQTPANCANPALAPRSAATGHAHVQPCPVLPLAKTMGMGHGP